MEDAITEMTGAEMEMALRNTKNGKATGLDNLPVEVWKSLRSTGVDILKEALKTIRSLTRRTPQIYGEKASWYPSSRVNETS